MSDLWLTKTPLGTPVDPEVNIEYTGSVSIDSPRISSRALLSSSDIEFLIMV